jgi:hypothetical protein
MRDETMHPLMTTILFLLAATVGARADELPGQASGVCSMPGNIAVDGARASASSPFLGVFDGRWEGVLPVTLIVYDVSGARAYGFYAWRTYTPWRVTAGCRRVLGTIKAGRLEFKGRDTMAFEVTGRRLAGTYYFNPGSNSELIEKSTFLRVR